MYATKCTPYTHLCGWFHKIAKIRAVQLGYPPSPPQHSDAGRKLFQGVVHWSRRKCNLTSRQTHWHPLEPGTCRWGSSVSSFRQLKRVFHILYNGKFTKLMHSLWYRIVLCTNLSSCTIQCNVCGDRWGSLLSVQFFPSSCLANQ